MWTDKMLWENQFKNVHDNDNGNWSKNYAHIVAETITYDMLLFSFSVHSIEMETQAYFYTLLMLLLLFVCVLVVSVDFQMTKIIQTQIGQRVVRFSNINLNMSAISYEIQFVCFFAFSFYMLVDLYRKVYDISRMHYSDSIRMRSNEYFICSLILADRFRSVWSVLIED